MFVLYHRYFRCQGGFFVKRQDYQARRKDEAAATRRAIADAAAALSREKGFDKMSVRDVCARAGVTTGAFYHHFSSKEELLTRGFSTLDDYLETAMESCPSQAPQDRLEFLLRAYAKCVEEQGWQNLSLYYARRLSGAGAAALSPDRFTLRTMERCFQELSEGGVLSPRYDPRWIADFCFRHFRGVVIDWILHRGEYPLWDKLEEDYRLFDQALRS